MIRHHIPLRPHLGSLVALSVTLTLLGGLAAQAQDAATDSAAASATVDQDANSENDPNLVTYPENEEPNEVPGDNSIKPRPVSPAQKEALRRRAGEQVGDTPRGRAMVLGMHIQEADYERAKVVEVGPATPAFDAGIRKGDEIVSFDGFKATTYREWIDGMRRLAIDVPDGDSIPIVLRRDGKQLNLRLRVPVDKTAVPPAGDVTVNQAIMPEEGVAVGGQAAGGQSPFVPGVGYGGDTLIATELGDDFNSPDGENRGRAVAELFRLNVPRPADQAAAGQTNALAQPRARDRALRRGSAGNTGARVGVAGFRNDANGMLVMLDVSGLAPGVYLVGIDDPSLLMTGGTAANAVQNELPQNPRARTGSAVPRVVPPSQPPRQRPAPDQGVTPPAVQPGPQPQPSNPPSTSPAPQSRLDAPPERAAIPRTVLAQVADTPGAGSTAPVSSGSGAAPTNAPATGTGQAERIPATGSAQPLDTPPTGQVNRNGATPTGLPRNGDPRQNVNVANETDANGAFAGGGPALRIGTLTINQGGTGRLQQVIESASVQDVVGQAIVIYSQDANQSGSVAPNVGNINPAAGVGVRRAPAGGSGQRGARAVDSAGSIAAAQPGSSNTAPANVSGGSIVGNVPVAGGVIRMLGMTSPVDRSTAEQVVPTPQTPNAVQGVPQNSNVPLPQPRVR